MSEIDARHFRVWVDGIKDPLIVMDRYKSLAEFKCELRQCWEHDRPVETRNSGPMMINPDYIRMIDGPHDVLFVINWHQ